jgi:hypothetical protein
MGFGCWMDGNVCDCLSWKFSWRFCTVLPHATTARTTTFGWNIGRDLWTYGPSVQVKTCPKPHDRTSFSAEARDLVMVGFLVLVWEEGSFDDGSR